MPTAEVTQELLRALDEATAQLDIVTAYFDAQVRYSAEQAEAMEAMIDVATVRNAAQAAMEAVGLEWRGRHPEDF